MLFHYELELKFSRKTAQLQKEKVGNFSPAKRNSSGREISERNTGRFQAVQSNLSRVINPGSVRHDNPDNSAPTFVATSASPASEAARLIPSHSREISS